MATSHGGEDSITSREPCSSADNLLSVSAPKIQRSSNKPGRLWRKCSFRSIGSRSVLPVLAWVFIIQSTLGFTLHKMQYSKVVKSNEDEESSVVLWTQKSTYLISLSVLSVSCPIASLLAEVVIGRYKLMSYTLRALWLLSIISALISLCEESLPLAGTTIYNIQLIVLVIPLYLLQGAFLASAVPLGRDQISTGSDTNISAFILWFLWAFFCGLGAPSTIGAILYKCSDLKASDVGLILSLMAVVLLSVGLILDFYFHHILVKEPVSRTNPVKLIFKVLKYAAKHKYPVQRSAFTYCENKQPTRLDYGKSKYGGPFTTEQVEDVKTFWRIVLVILVLLTIHISIFGNFESALTLGKDHDYNTRCIQTTSYNSFKPTSIIVYTIPLYELLVYPCLRNRGPTILQSAGVGAGAVVLTSLVGITAESIKQIRTNGTNECIFSKDVHSKDEVDLFLSISFNLILGIATVVSSKASIVFVCAQAPYNMNGLLIGLLFTFMTLFGVIGSFIYISWRKTLLAIHHTTSCGIWFYLITLSFAAASFALLCLVGRWYKPRERDEITRSQTLVEEIYHKYQEQAPQY